MEEGAPAPDAPAGPTWSCEGGTPPAAPSVADHRSADPFRPLHTHCCLCAGGVFQKLKQTSAVEGFVVSRWRCHLTGLRRTWRTMLDALPWPTPARTKKCLCFSLLF